MEIIKNIYDEYTNLINNFFENKSKETIKNNSQYFTPFNEADKLLEDLIITKKNSFKSFRPSCWWCGILVIKLLEKILDKYIPSSIVIDVYDTDLEALEIIDILLKSESLQNITLNSISLIKIFYQAILMISMISSSKSTI